MTKRSPSRSTAARRLRKSSSRHHRFLRLAHEPLERRDLLAGFTPNHLALVLVGDGSAPLGSNIASAAHIAEYSLVGNLLQTFQLPTVTTGNQRALTLSSSSNTEGLSTITTNGQFIMFVGYNAPVGTASINSSSSLTIPRTVARIDALGNIDTSTALTDFAHQSNPRSVTSTNGIDLWLGGGNGGVRYATLGATTSTSISTIVDNVRQVAIIDNQLILSTGDNGKRVSTVGSGLPTTPSQPVTVLSGITDTNTANPYQFVALDLDEGVPGADVLFVAARGVGVRKFYKSGSTWTAAGGFTNTNANLTGVVALQEGNTIRVFATNPTGLYSANDTAGRTGMVSGSMTLIASAPTNTEFRGLTLTPQSPNAIPVIELPSPATSYVATQYAVFLDSAANVIDTDSADFVGGALVVSNASGEVTDQIEILPEGSAAGQIGISGSSITYGGNFIGTFSGGQGTTPLEINFTTSVATSEAVTALIRRLAFQSTIPTPMTTARSIELILTDGDGGTSAPATKIVNVVLPVEVTLQGATQAEGNTGTSELEFVVTLAHDPLSPVTISYSTIDDSATAADNDYSPITGGQLTFLPGGPLTQTISITIVGDNQYELDESFLVELTGVSGPAVLATSSAIGLITNDDPLPQISIAPRTLAEGSAGETTFDFTLTLSHPSSQPITVLASTQDDTATALDNDYTPLVNELITFAPGETTATLNVQVQSDLFVEPDEQFVVLLSEPTNATLQVEQAIGTITNDDQPPRLSINSAATIEGDSGTTLLIFTVSLSAPPQVPVTVEVTTSDDTATAADNDYTPLLTPQTLTFLPGQPLAQTIAIEIHGDTKYETTEQFFVNLANATSAVIEGGQGVGTIENDDPLPTVNIQSVTTLEGDSGTTTVLFEVVLSNFSSQAITVDYSTSDGTATIADDDYTPISGSLLFAVNTTELVQTIAVEIQGDTKFEPDETFVVALTIAGAANESAEATVTITNDDPSPHLVISADAGPASAANDGQPDTYQLALASGGQTLEIHINGALALSRSLSSIDSLTIHGSSDEDTLHIDASGAWALWGMLTFTGTALGANLSGQDDAVFIHGTPQDDNLRVFQDAGVLQVTLNGTSGSLALANDEGELTVKQVRIETGDGADTVELNWRDHADVHLGVDANASNAMRYFVQGGEDASHDTLLVIDDGIDDFAMLRKLPDPLAGIVTIGPGNSEPLVAEYVGIESILFRTTLDDGTSPESPVAPNTAGTNSRLVVFGFTTSEPNDDPLTATVLAANGAHQEAIHPAGDVDWYQITASVTGTLDLAATFAHLAQIPESQRPGLPGDGDLNLELYNSQGVLIVPPQPFGTNSDTDNERIRIPAVQGETYYLRVLGATESASNSYSLISTNLPLPAPHAVQLATGSTTTNNALPTIHVRLADDGLLLDALPIPFQTAALPGYRVAIFVDDEPAPHGYAEATETAGLYAYTLLAPLVDGPHSVSARVEIIDPTPEAATGLGPSSSVLAFSIDTTARAISWGDAGVDDDGLHPASDTGVVGAAATFTDRMTSITTPTFWGQAEAGAIVRVYADLNGNGAIDAEEPLIATAMADATGQWQATATLSLNAAIFGEIDGHRPLLATAEDAVGNVSSPVPFELFLDTQAPVVTAIFIPAAPNYPVLAPTSISPLIRSLSLRVRDLPLRSDNFLASALLAGSATAPGHYQLHGDFTGPVAINNITFTPGPLIAGEAADAVLTLHFATALPDDRFTLTVSDALVDRAGNKLDGETNAQQPVANVQFPSGDGNGGGNFVARFTVDSRPEIATWSGQTAWVDTNGNGLFDPAASGDAKHRDLVYQLGATPLAMFAGNFSLLAVGAADGFDKLAGYYEVDGQHVFLVDVDHDGVPDNEPGIFPAVDSELTILNLAGQPLAGRFDDSDTNGDEVGLFDGTTFYFDTNHNFVLDEADDVLVSEMRGHAIVGDFDGDGFDDLAAWEDGVFSIDLALGQRRGWDGVADFVVRYTLHGATDRPLAADLDGDSIDDLGLWSPALIETSPENRAQWAFIVSAGNPLVQPGFEIGDPGHRVAASPLDGAASFLFTPVPFGPDLSFDFGDVDALPLVGNFDPPVVQDPASLAGDYTNRADPLDVNGDGVISPLDAVLVVNNLNVSGPRLFTSTARTTTGPFLDVNGDRFMTTLDAQLIIIHLNAGGAEESPGEGEPPLATLVNSSRETEIAPHSMLPVMESEHAAHDDNDSRLFAWLDDFFATQPQAAVAVQPLWSPLDDALFAFEEDLHFARDDEDFTMALAELFAFTFDD